MPSDVWYVWGPHHYASPHHEHHNDHHHYDYYDFHFNV
jgi:hypothetical protein